MSSAPGRQATEGPKWVLEGSTRRMRRADAVVRRGRRRRRGSRGGRAVSGRLLTGGGADEVLAFSM